MEIYYKNHHNTTVVISRYNEYFEIEKTVFFIISRKQNSLIFLLESNIPLMCSKNTDLIGSLNPNSTLVTRGIYYNTKMGYVYTIEIFGNTDAYFRDHLILYI